MPDSAMAARVHRLEPGRACLARRRAFIAQRRNCECGNRIQPGATVEAGEDLLLHARIPEAGDVVGRCADSGRSEEHTSELQSLMRISYAVFCLKKKNHKLCVNK